MKNNILKAFFIYKRLPSRVKCYFERLYDSKIRFLFSFIEEHLDAIMPNIINNALK